MVSDNGILTMDAGSFPMPDIDDELYREGALESFYRKESKAIDHFIEVQKQTFVEKLKRLDTPCYVQSGSPLWSMNKMFLDPIVENHDWMNYDGDYKLDSYKQNRGFSAEGRKFDSLIYGKFYEFKIPEVEFIKEHAKSLCEEADVDKIRYFVPVTGPIELLDHIKNPKHGVIEDITEVLIEYVQNSHSNTKYAEMIGVTIDEPSYLFSDNFDDPEKLEIILKSWDRIYDSVDCEWNGLHIHRDPNPNIFSSKWNLLIGEPDAYMKKEEVEDHDKFIRAGIMRTDIDSMLAKHDDPALAWKMIESENREDWEIYLEPREEMRKRLVKYVEKYGIERIPFAGTACGLGSWKNPAFALAALDNMVSIVKDFKPRQVA